MDLKVFKCNFLFILISCVTIILSFSILIFKYILISYLFHQSILCAHIFVLAHYLEDLLMPIFLVDPPLIQLFTFVYGHFPFTCNRVDLYFKTDIKFIKFSKYRIIF